MPTKFRRLRNRVLILVSTLTVVLTTCTNPTFIEFVRYVAPGAVYPTNAAYLNGDQWNLDMVNAPGAWGIVEQVLSTLSYHDPAIVAVIDTQVSEHADLAGKIIDVEEIVPGGGPNEDGLGKEHGTHVTGIIAAEPAETDTGVTGVAYRYVEIVAIRALSDGGGGTTADINTAIQYAGNFETGTLNRRVNVINLSLGGGLPDPSLYAAIESAVRRGITVVAASGNSGLEGMIVPAYFDNTIAVGSVGRDAVRSQFSQYGPGLDFVGPGSSIYSTFETSSYAVASGTSMATPHVAGVVALLYALEPGLNQEAVYSILRATARDLGAPGWDKYYGHGLVDAKAALEYLINLQGRIPRAPMGAYAVGGSGGLRLEPQTLSGAQLPESGAEYDSQSVILRFHDGQGPSGTDGVEQLELQLIERYGVASVRLIGEETVVVGLGPGQEPVTVMQSLADLPEVQYSQPNFIYRSIR